MKRLVMVALAAALWLTPAWGDVTVKMSAGAPGAPDRNKGTMYLTPTRLAMIWDAGKDKAEGGHFIFDSGKETMWIVNDAEKSYMMLDKETIDNMGKQMDQAMGQMQEALAKMTPEQRKMVEKQMGKVMNAGAQQPAAEHKVAKSGESKSISGFSCTRYDMSQDGKVTSQIWATPYSQLKVTAADFAVVGKMAEMFKSMTGRMSQLAHTQRNPFQAGTQIDGVPILTQNLDDGKVTLDTLIESVTHDAPPPGVFDVPAGYKQQEMPKMSGEGK